MIDPSDDVTVRFYARPRNPTPLPRQRAPQGSEPPRPSTSDELEFDDEVTATFTLPQPLLS